MMQRRSKYNARKAEIDGHVFDSITEANRYQELLLLERAGEIIELKLQPEFVLLPAYTDNKGKRQRSVMYRGDFQYFENGQQVVEDVKGFETPVYKLKRKLFLYSFPEIDFREVR